MTQKDMSLQTVIQSQKGVSALEALAAVAVVVMIALASGSFFSQQKSFLDHSATGAACRSVLEGQMNYLRQQSTMPQGLPWMDLPPTAAAGSTRVRKYDKSSFQELAFNENNVRFNNLPESVVEATQPSGSMVPAPGKVNPAGLLTGSMGTLNALYNRVPGICNPGVEAKNLFNSNSIFSPTMDKDPLRNFKSTIQVQPINLLSESIDCTKSNFWIRPQGVKDPTAFSPAIVEGGSDPTKYGYRVILKAQYEDADNQVQECQMTEDFRFPVDHAQQVVSAVVTSELAPQQGWDNTDPNLNPPRAQCSQVPGQTPNLTVKIDIKPQPGSQLETGTTLLCADLSRQMNANYCIHPSTGEAPGAGMQGEFYPPADPSDPSKPGTLTPETATWVPCSEVTACGIPPTTFRKDNPPDAKNGGTTYTLNYQGTKSSRDGLWGCDIRIDVATVDTAGNFKMISTKDASGAWNPPVVQRYFPPTECWGCYKKKKRNWVKTIAAVGMFGLVGACLTGAGNVCRPSGYRWAGYKCKNEPPSKGFCRKAMPTMPSWVPLPPQAYCKSDIRPLPAPFNAQQYTLPRRPPGGVHQETFFFEDKGAFCDVNASCKEDQSGIWEGMLDENDQMTPIASCGRVLTRYKINISGMAAGSPVPPGSPECFIAIPPEAEPMPVMTKTNYAGYQVCATGIPNKKVLCAPDPSNPLNPWILPPDAMTGVPNNADQDKYFYFEHDVPMVSGLKECAP